MECEWENIEEHHRPAKADPTVIENVCSKISYRTTLFSVVEVYED